MKLFRSPWFLVVIIPILIIGAIAFAIWRDVSQTQPQAT